VTPVYAAWSVYFWSVFVSTRGPAPVIQVPMRHSESLFFSYKAASAAVDVWSTNMPRFICSKRALSAEQGFSACPKADD